MISFLFDRKLNINFTDYSIENSIKIDNNIKTVNANTSLPVYLYINGKQANVVGGEGIMLKQPLNEGSIDG